MVKRVVEKDTGKEFALKIIGNTDAERIEGVKLQFKLLRFLDLPSVIKAQNLYICEQASTCRLIMELCEWPSLRTELQRFSRFSETMAAEVAKTLLQTAEYLHSHGVVHRDIKPDNVLYEAEEGTLKLIDFGVSALERPGQADLWTVTGSLYYKAPEMFAGSYNNKVDVWAVGVVVYELLHGHTPFAREFLNDTVEGIRHTSIDECLGADLEPFTRDFLRKCLAKDPQVRLSAREAMKEPFILQACNKSITQKNSSGCLS